MEMDNLNKIDGEQLDKILCDLKNSLEKSSVETGYSLDGDCDFIKQQLRRLRKELFNNINTIDSLILTKRTSWSSGEEESEEELDEVPKEEPERET